MSKNTVKAYLKKLDGARCDVQDLLALEDPELQARKSDHGQLAQACTLALEHRQYSYKFIRNLLANNMTGGAEATTNKPLPKHSNVRGIRLLHKTSNSKTLNL